MNTIEPDFLRESRQLVTDLYSSGEINSPVLVDLERERNEWFISVLERDAISNREEDRRRFWEELNVFGYAYIGKIKVHRILFKVLYKLKLVDI